MGKPITPTQTPKESLPRWYYLLFAVVVMVQLTGSLLLNDIKNKALLQHTKITDTLNNAVQNINLYHLWLEEYVTHPSDENQQETSKSYALTHSEFSELQYMIHQHMWKHAQIMSDTAELTGDIKQLLELGQKRMQSPGLSGIDSQMDDEFDARFIDILTQTQQLKLTFRSEFNEERAAIHLKRNIIFTLGLLLLFSLMITLLIVDRRRGNLWANVLLAEAGAREEEAQRRVALEDSIANKNALLKQAAKLKLHFEQTPLGIIEWTADFDVVMWNPAAERIFGYTAEEATGRNASELILNEAMQLEVTNTIKELLTDTGGYRSINHNITKDGRILLCDWYNTPLLDSDGNIVGTSSLVIDITEQKQLEASYARLAGMLDNSTDFVGTADHEGRMTYINNTGRKMVGLTEDEPIDQLNMSNFLSAKGLSHLQHEVFPHIAEQGIAVRENITFLDKEGHEILTSCVVILETDENNHITHYMAVAHDLREEQQAQAKLEHVQRLESLGVLAGGIAHDFNNILTGILGNTALASNKLTASSPIRSYLKNVEEGSQRAAELCKQMLAYSGKGKFVITAIDLNHMIHEIIRLMEVSIAKNVVLKYHLGENLPMVEGDAAQLQQVLMNLIINASEAIEGKSGVISISTGVMSVDTNYLITTTADEATTPAGRYIFLEVSDTGCGMDKSTRKKIFDPFFTTKFTGRGLGMSAILGIVNGHNGSIKCYSEVGRGTTFKVLLPCSDKSPLNGNTIKQAEKKTVNISGAALVVDDEETVREVAGMMLEEMGFDILKAKDGQEGVSLFRQHHQDIQLVLLDMTMPRMDGVEAFREMQRIDPDVKVILSSGYNEQDATNRFAGKGLAGFIQKPYLPDALQQTVGDILKSSKKS